MNNFEKDFFKLMNNTVFGKIMKNVRKHSDIKLISTEKRRKYLLSDPNHHTKFLENLLAIETGKTQILTNKQVYLGLSISELNKTVIQEFWYDNLKTKLWKKKQKCVKWIQTLHTRKQMMFQRTLHKILKKGLILQIRN